MVFPEGFCLAVDASFFFFLLTDHGADHAMAAILEASKCEPRANRREPSSASIRYPDISLYLRSTD